MVSYLGLNWPPVISFEPCPTVEDNLRRHIFEIIHVASIVLGYYVTSAFVRTDPCTVVVNGSAATTTTPYRTQRVHLHNLLMIHAAGRSAQSGQLREAFR